MVKKGKHASLKDIAQYVGVSTSLVSFVLNGKGRQHRVSEEMIKTINEAAQKLNYQPNTFAKSLREGKSRVFGVVLSDISNPFFSSIARCLEDEAQKRGYSVLFSSSDENSEKAEVQVANLLSRGVDAMIFVPCENSRSTVRYIEETGKPLVLLDRCFPEISTSSVCLNNREISFKATSHLLEAGFKHPGVIAYDFQLQHMRDRIDGYRDAMKAHGLEDLICERRIRADKLHDTVKEQIVQMQDEGVDSLLFATNNIAVESLYAIRELGIKVPEEMGLIGFDGGLAFDFFSAPLSYIRQPIPLMAQKAVEIILDELSSGEKMVQQIRVPGTLVLNASTKRKKA